MKIIQLSLLGLLCLTVLSFLLQSIEASMTRASSVPSIDVAGIPLGYQDFFFVGTLEKGGSYEKHRDTLFINKCRAWTLKRENLHQLLANMEQVSNTHEAYVRCYDYATWYVGNVSNADMAYKVLISATSYVHLYTADTTLFFIQPDTTDIFLAPCDCCEY